MREANGFETFVKSSRGKERRVHHGGEQRVRQSLRTLLAWVQRVTHAKCHVFACTSTPYTIALSTVMLCAPFGFLHRMLLGRQLTGFFFSAFSLFFCVSPPWLPPRLSCSRQARQAAEKEARKRVPPEEMFLSQTDLYSAFDESGVPTKDKGGEPLSKSAIKKLKKEWEKRKKLYEKSQAEAATG